MSDFVRLMTDKLNLSDYTHVSFRPDLADYVVSYFREMDFRDLNARSADEDGVRKSIEPERTLIRHDGARIDFRTALDFFKLGPDERNVYVRFSEIGEEDIDKIVHDLNLIENIHYDWSPPGGDLNIVHLATDSR